MRNKKSIVRTLLFVLLAGLLSSCAIDRVCPAYTQTPAAAEQGVRS